MMVYHSDESRVFHTWTHCPRGRVISWLNWQPGPGGKIQCRWCRLEEWYILVWTRRQFFAR